MTDYSKVIHRGIESKDLDYKGSMIWNENNNKEHCCRLVKDIIAMANTEGGWIVIGVEEQNTGFVPSGIAEDAAGSFESSRLNRFLNNYVDPPINTEIIKYPEENKLFVIIRIPEFKNSPHICKRDYPNILTKAALYIRTDNVESAQIISANDMRGLLDKAVRKQGDWLIARIRAILSTEGASEIEDSFQRYYSTNFEASIDRFEAEYPLKDKKYDCFLEVFWYPILWNNSRIEYERLLPLIRSAYVDYKGWPFIFAPDARPDVIAMIQDGIEGKIYYEGFQNEDNYDFWRLYLDGSFYHRILAWYESLLQIRQGAKVFGIRTLANYVAEAIKAMTTINEQVCVPGESITMRFRILGTKDRQLTTFEPGRDFFPSHKAAIDEITSEKTYVLSEWIAGLNEIAVNICVEIFQRFNWQKPDSRMIREYIEKLFARKY